MRICMIALLAALPLQAAELKTLEDIRIRDPFVLPVTEEGMYFLYGTGRPLGEPGFDMYKSMDLKHWSGPVPVFRPDPGYWGQEDFWAPEVHRYRGKYYMFATFSPKGEGATGHGDTGRRRPARALPAPFGWPGDTRRLARAGRHPLHRRRRPSLDGVLS